MASVTETERNLFLIEKSLQFISICSVHANVWLIHTAQWICNSIYISCVFTPPNSPKIKFRKLTVSKKCVFQSEPHSISSVLSSCLSGCERVHGSMKQDPKLLLLFQQRLQAVALSSAPQTLCVSSVLPSQLQQCSPVCLHAAEATSPVVAGAGHSVFSRISQMCLNFWSKDLFTTWKILAVNQHIRLWSLMMHPGTVPVCFSLILLVGNTLQLAWAWGVGWKTLAAAWL